MKTTLKARPDGCLSDLAIDRLLAEEPSATSREHLAGCESCRARFDALSLERDAFQEDKPGAQAFSTALRGRERARRWPVVTASVGALALAAAVLLFLRTKPSNEEGASATRLKGTAHIGFYVKHGEVVTVGAAGARVRPGDSLRFVYTSSEPRHIAVLSLDGAHRGSVYYPTTASRSARAERVEPAVDRPLESSTVLDETLGGERLYGIFCGEPIALEPVRASLEATGALPALDGCVVDTLEIRKEAVTTP